MWKRSTSFPCHHTRDAKFVAPMGCSKACFCHRRGIPVPGAPVPAHNCDWAVPFCPSMLLLSCPLMRFLLTSVTRLFLFGLASSSSCLPSRASPAAAGGAPDGQGGSRGPVLSGQDVQGPGTPLPRFTRGAALRHILLPWGRWGGQRHNGGSPKQQKVAALLLPRAQIEGEGGREMRRLQG